MLNTAAQQTLLGYTKERMTVRSGRGRGETVARLL